MGFVCTNPACSAPENKKGKAYPSAMECPFCDAPLCEVFSFPEVEEKLLSSLPYVIAYPLRRALAEKHAWTKINLLKDTFLNYLKYLGLLTASEFFNSPLKDKKMVALFQQALAEPSFGSWNQYIRETIHYLKEHEHEFFCPELPAYYESVETGKKRKLYKGEIEYIDSNGDVQLKKQEATAIGMLINFRNRYLGHGLTLDEGSSAKLWEEYYPIFRQLLEQMSFPAKYPMFKHEHGETYLLQSAEIIPVERGRQASARVWLENPILESIDILPFFVVPGEVSIGKEDKEQILAYESYTGKTIKFFSPEGTEKQTSGKILERLNLLLRDKQKEQPFSPEDFTKEVFFTRIADENKLILDTLIAEKKVIPGVYVQRQDMEIKLREWIGARASIYFIAAEAGSGKTNLLVEIQRQYTERELPSLLIRAGRMEKPSLKQQIAYLLNIDSEQGLERYKSISGTQAHPTFILIDGLNEANNAEGIWLEALEITKLFDPGSLKFVIANRANTKADVERYGLLDEFETVLYGENKEHQKGLGAYIHWLTPLNMAEMKDAWEGYCKKDKNKFKPQFTFDDLAAFDRSLYSHISNPLVLRLFLETYHGKTLPKKGNKHLNIWQDWIATFSETEIQFLKLLAQEVWNKGENELLLSDLLNNEIIKPYLTTDQINAPYPRLKNNGWISRYLKDLNVCISFTVEGALLYLIGCTINENQKYASIDAIKSLLNSGTPIQQSAVVSFLSQKALNGDLQVVSQLIDAGQEYHSFINPSMILFLRSFGVKSFIDKIFESASENDWHALLNFDVMLDELQEQVLRKQFLEELMPLNPFNTKPSIQLGIKGCYMMDKDDAQRYLNLIDSSLERFSDSAEILESCGHLYKKYADYEMALNLFQRCLNIRLKSMDLENLDVALSYDQIGSTLLEKGEYDLALNFYYKSFDIKFKLFGIKQISLGSLYNNIGVVMVNKGEYEKALEYYEKSLSISLKYFGAEHMNVAALYYNIGVLLAKNETDNEALKYYQKCLDVRIKLLGQNHPEVADCYNRIGVILAKQGSYDQALDFSKKCLDIRLKSFGMEHPAVAACYNTIGLVWAKKDSNDKALEFYQKCLAIRLKALGAVHPDVATSYNKIGGLYLKKGANELALDYFKKCLDIRIITLGAEHPYLATSYNNIAVVLDDKGLYDQALELYQKCLYIKEKKLRPGHPDLAISYKNIGLVWENKKVYDKAIDSYKKSLDIMFNNFNGEDLETAEMYFKIGSCFQKLEKYDFAIESFNKGFVINNAGGFLFQIAACMEIQGNKYEALNYYVQSAEIRKTHPEIGLDHESTFFSIQNAIRLARELSKEVDLPDWIRTIN